MRQTVRRFALFASIALIALFGISCPEDGGDGDGDEQAVITEADFNQGLTFLADTLGCEISDGEVAVAATARNPALFSTLLTQLQSKVGTAATSLAVLQVEQTETEQIAGSCGGTLDITVTSDDETGEFSGTIVATDFCEEIGGQSTTLTGTIEFSGVIGDTSLTLLASSDGLTLTNADGSIFITFDIDVEGTDDSITVMGFIATTNNGNETSLENIDLTITLGEDTIMITGSVDLVVDGRTVNILITEPLVIDASGALVDGMLDVAGAQGTNITVIVVGANEFELVGNNGAFSTMLSCPPVMLPVLEG